MRPGNSIAMKPDPFTSLVDIAVGALAVALVFSLRPPTTFGQTAAPQRPPVNAQYLDKLAKAEALVRDLTDQADDAQREYAPRQRIEVQGPSHRCRPGRSRGQAARPAAQGESCQERTCGPPRESAAGCCQSADQARCRTGRHGPAEQGPDASRHVRRRCQVRGQRRYRRRRDGNLGGVPEGPSPTARKRMPPASS